MNFNHKTVGQTHDVRQATPIRKTIQRQRWKWIALRASCYLLLATLAFAAGGYAYVQWHILDVIHYTDIDTVIEYEPPVVVTDPEGSVVATEKENPLDGLVAEDIIAQGDTESSWSQGGHVPVYVDERYPIKRVAQKDPSVTNILVFGVDARGTNDVHCRADAIIVVSFDQKTNSIRLISLLRDTAVRIEGKSVPDKLTHAYVFGGVGLLINTINENFQLDVQKFVMLDFSSATDVIDLMGGVPIEVMPKEIPYANESIKEQNYYMGTKVKYLNTTGLQMLNGVQATAWARIRHLDSDFKRSERQRILAQVLIEKVSAQGTWMQMTILKECAGMFETNMTQNELLGVGTQGVQMADDIRQFRAPEDGMFTVQEEPWMEIVDWTRQIPSLHEYIWGDDRQ